MVRRLASSTVLAFGPCRNTTFPATLHSNPAMSLTTWWTCIKHERCSQELPEIVLAFPYVQQEFRVRIPSVSRVSILDALPRLQACCALLSATKRTAKTTTPATSQARFIRLRSCASPVIRPEPVEVPGRKGEKGPHSRVFGPWHAFAFRERGVGQCRA